jgi:HK97 family phage portal protein
MESRDSTLRDPADWLLEWFVGPETASGERVNEIIALGLSAWYAAIRNISEDVSKMDLILYRRKPNGGKERAPEHPLFGLLHDRPNPDMTKMAFWETILQHALGWGNGYAEIVTDGRGVPVELWPLDPSTITFRAKDGRRFYEITLESGGKLEVPLGQIFHIHGIGSIGYEGYNLTRIAREALGGYIALQKFGNAFFSSGATVGAVLEHPESLSDTGLRHLRESWNERHGSAGNAHKLAILEEGMKYSQLGIAPEQGQFSQSKMFAVEDVARWFRMPPHKIQHMERSTFGNIEHQAIEYVGDTLLPWSKRIEQQISLKLISPRRESDLFAEHLIDSLLRADIETRNKAYKTAVEGGWMSRNEVRIRENMDPEPDLDDYLMPLNMAVVGEEPPVPPTPTPPPPPEDDVTRALGRAHEPLMTERYAAILRTEREKMKRASKRDDYPDWLAKFRGDHQPYVRAALVPAVDTFCASVWAMVNGGEMTVEALDGVGMVTERLAERHMAVDWDAADADILAREAMEQLIEECRKWTSTKSE